MVRQISFHGFSSWGFLFCCLPQRVWNDYRDRAFLPSYDLAPPPTPFPPPLLPVSSTGDTQRDWVKERQLAFGRGGMGGGGAKFRRQREAWSSTNHSILSGFAHSYYFFFRLHFGVRWDSFFHSSPSLNYDTAWTIKHSKRIQQLIYTCKSW